MLWHLQIILLAANGSVLSTASGAVCGWLAGWLAAPPNHSVAAEPHCRAGPGQRDDERFDALKCEMEAVAVNLRQRANKVLAFVCLAFLTLHIFFVILILAFGRNTTKFP